MLPVVIGIGQAFGVEALPIAVAMVVCRNCATFISPMVPATLLGTGLAEVDIKDHIKASFMYVWGFSFLCMIVAIIFGIMPLVDGIMLIVDLIQGSASYFDNPAFIMWL